MTAVVLASITGRKPVPQIWRHPHAPSLGLFLWLHGCYGALGVVPTAASASSSSCWSLYHLFQWAQLCGPSPGLSLLLLRGAWSAPSCIARGTKIKKRLSLLLLLQLEKCCGKENRCWALHVQMLGEGFAPDCRCSEARSDWG